MKNFNNYLQRLAAHEEKKAKSRLTSSREKLLVWAGVLLNWLGDYLANPEIQWEGMELPIEKIQFTGTDPEWNKILIHQCGRSVKKFKKLLKSNPKIRNKFKKETSDRYRNELILVRKSEDLGYYKVLDGMHRFVWLVLNGEQIVKVYVPINEDECLPICEAHVVYDLIRGFIRHGKGKQGEIELYYGLMLLARTYANVKDLLAKRFDEKHVMDKDVQEVIRRVLEKSK